MTTIQFELPDELALMAADAGLLNSQAFERFLRQQLNAVPAQTATPQAANKPFTTDDPAFGIWSDHEASEDVAAYVRKIRQPRYNRDGSRNEPS